MANALVNAVFDSVCCNKGMYYSFIGFLGFLKDGLPFMQLLLIRIAYSKFIRREFHFT